MGNSDRELRIPMVSIGLPVFNGEVFLEESLCTILDQTFRDFEVVISDNASTDETEAICRRFEKLDSRVRYVRQERNLGAARNYNIVFELSRGKYFRWAAHDDLMKPLYLEYCVRVFEEDGGSDVGLVFPRTIHFDERTGVSAKYSVPFFEREMSPSQRLQHSLLGQRETILTKCYPVFGLMRADILSTTRLIQPFNSSDKVLLVEMMLRGDFREVDSYLFHRRLHDNTSLNACRSQEEVARWFDPGNRDRYPMPHTKLLLGYICAVLNAPLTLGSKCKSLIIVARWCATDRVWWAVIKDILKRTIRDLGISAGRSTPIPKEYVD